MPAVTRREPVGQQGLSPPRSQTLSVRSGDTIPIRVEWLGGGVKPPVNRPAELSLGSGRQGLAASRGGGMALQPTDPEADSGDGYHDSSREAHRRLDRPEHAV